jgi:hypothetical protein
MYNILKVKRSEAREKEVRRSKSSVSAQVTLVIDKTHKFGRRSIRAQPFLHKL